MDSHEGSRYDEHEQVGEGDQDEQNEGPVVIRAHAIIYPNAVMVEGGGTSVTDLTVLALAGTEAVAMLAVTVLAEVSIEQYVPVQFRPFVMIDDHVSWVGGRADRPCDQQDDTEPAVQAQHDVVLVQLTQAHKVHDDFCSYD